MFGRQLYGYRSFRSVGHFGTRGRSLRSFVEVFGRRPPSVRLLINQHILIIFGEFLGQPIVSVISDGDREYFPWLSDGRSPGKFPWLSVGVPRSTDYTQAYPQGVCVHRRFVRAQRRPAGALMSRCLLLPTKLHLSPPQTASTKTLAA